jgi:Cu/Ag efflux pump CusA
LVLASVIRSVIRIRLVGDDVDELHAAATAVGQVLDIHQASEPVARRTTGVSLYLRASLPTPAAHDTDGSFEDTPTF